MKIFLRLMGGLSAVSSQFSDMTRYIRGISKLKPTVFYLLPKKEISAVSHQPSELGNRSSALKRRLPTLCLLSPNTYKRIIPILFILVFVSCSAALAQEQGVHTAPAAKAESKITPLKIGDRIPDELWEMYFPVINGTNDQIQYINLGEFRDRVIVLDFWATWCGSCISAMPHLDELQKEFQDDLLIIPITYEKADKVQEFLRNTKSPILNAVKPDFLSIVDDRYIRSHFDFKTIPQAIVIRNKKVESLTMPIMLNQGNISAMIKGEVAYVAKKRYGELERPLLKLAFDDVKTQGPLFYSTITGYMDGVINAARHERDILNNVQRYYQTSLSVTHLYSVTGLFGGYAVNSKRRILEVKEPYRYTNFRKEDGSYATSDLSWKRENAYNYESLMPLYLSDSAVMHRFKGDLDLYFGLSARKDKRSIPVWILKEGKKLSGTKLLSDKMIYVLNSIPTIPLLINEAELKGDEMFDVSDIEITSRALSNTLKEYGLELVEEEREMEMFVLTEQGYQKPSSKLEISRYGYIYPSKKINP